MDTQVETSQKLNGLTVDDDTALRVHGSTFAEQTNGTVTSQARVKRKPNACRMVSFSNVDQQHWYESDDVTQAQVTTQPETSAAGPMFKLDFDENDVTHDGVMNGDCKSHAVDQNIPEATHSTDSASTPNSDTACSCDTRDAQTDQHDVITVSTSPPKLQRSKSSWLLRLFESKHFDMSMAISYLFNSKEHGVQAYIGQCPHTPFLVFCVTNKQIPLTTAS